MRVVKPQSALIQLAPTQIGKQAQSRVSVGVGFRLSDPRILVHEAAVWEATKAFSATVCLSESALPKRHAEWLLLGHASALAFTSHTGRTKRWLAGASLGGIRKDLVCEAVVTPFDETCAKATMRVAPTDAAQTAMGPLDSRWPLRAKWRPKFADAGHAMAANGSHMGWPEAVDLRYFQHAAPDQWSRHAVWAAGAPFELHGFSLESEHCGGSLPRLQPLVLMRNRKSQAYERIALAQQTVWFLPDRDIGVIWWNGAASLPYLLSDELDLLAVALGGSEQLPDSEDLKDLVCRRTDTRQADILAQSDVFLMPPLAQGWAWERIRDSASHPVQCPLPESYDALRAAIVEGHRAAEEAQDHVQKARSAHAAAIPADFPEPDAGARAEDGFRALVQRGGGERELRERTFRNEDLSRLDLQDWGFQHLRFEGCVFDHSTWTDCAMENVSFVDCAMTAFHLHNVSWCDGGMSGCTLLRNRWLNPAWQRLVLNMLTVETLQVDGGTWRNLTLLDTRIDGLALHGIEVQSLHCGKVCAGGKLRWESASFTDTSIVESEWPRLEIQRCRVDKLSALKTNLDQSRWIASRMASLVLTHETSLASSYWQDCEITQGCFIEARAASMCVEYCSFVQLNAQGMEASQSRWAYCVLDHAQFTHANLAGATLEHCSLREAAAYGAELEGSTLVHSNLIQTGMAWTSAARARSWHSNLVGRQIIHPER
jgi:uncharacterized protein YjbI with pentapeptide repeats